MAIELMMCKEDHTAKDLRLLAQAPYFDLHLIRQQSGDPQPNRGALTLDDLSDKELLSAGTPICSNSIAPSTRQAFEKALGHTLPTITLEEQGPLMKSRTLRGLLRSRPEMQSDPTVGALYSLLKLATGLGFSVAWFEHIQERVPRGIR